MQKILVCDDDREIVEAISIYLSGEGYEILKAYDGTEALEIMEKTPVDLLIVDVMMPGLDGIRTTLKIRETSSIPIIILSAKSEDNDKILGLNIGADDYLTKPFNPLELVARVKSQLRRYTELGNMDTRDNSHLFSVGDLHINDETKEVTVSGNPVKLTPIEYNILLLLVRNAGKVFSIDEIYEKIWNEEAIGADDYLTKPFNPLELVARVKSQLRRYTELGNMDTRDNSHLFSVGDLQINDETKEVTVSGNPVKLTPIEYNILLLLVRNAGKVFSIDEIYEKIWNEEAIGADNTVAVHIRHIREKIEINPREPRYLKVVWGVGYKVEKQP